MEDPTINWSRAEQESRRFREAALEILRSAAPDRDRLGLYRDLARVLLAFSRCDSVELWRRRERSCDGWEYTAESDRMSGLPDLPYRGLEVLLEEGVRLDDETNSGGSRSVARFPLRVGDEAWGLLQLRSHRGALFTPPMMALLQDLSAVVAAALLHHRVHRGARERVKELSCLYRVSQAIAQTESSIADILQQVVEILPDGCRLPESRTARIVLDGEEFSTGEIAGALDLLSSDVVIYEKRRGSVEIAGWEPEGERHVVPFLEEERRMLETVAQQIAHLVRRRQAEADRRQLHEQLRHADRLATIGQLSAGVAHELNEPLGGILGFAQLIRKNPDLEPQLDQDLGRIEAAALHARGIVRKLMLFARQTPPGRKQVDLNQVVQESLGLLESRCQEGGIDIRLRLDPALPSIPADYGQLHQILVNLVVNALQAMPSGGELAVETRIGADHVELIVSDTGEGMTEEVRHQVFDPFFTTKDVGQGTGLGLAVVHGIVSSHGGRITLESSVGEGSRFEVHLPLKSPGHGNQAHE